MFWTQKYADKVMVMASVLWDSHSILFIVYLEKGNRINPCHKFIAKIVKLYELSFEFLSHTL